MCNVNQISRFVIRLIVRSDVIVFNYIITHMLLISVSHQALFHEMHILNAMSRYLKTKVSVSPVFIALDAYST